MLPMTLGAFRLPETERQDLVQAHLMVTGTSFHALESTFHPQEKTAGFTHVRASWSKSSEQHG
jgi:hypothetical protein